MEKAMTPEYLLEIARNTIEAVDCFLITSESGQANARLVQHFKPSRYDNLGRHEPLGLVGVKSVITIVSP